MWFTETTGNKIGRITPAGTITEYAIPTANANPEDISAGTDGDIYFTEANSNKLGYLNPTDPQDRRDVDTGRGREPLGHCSRTQRRGLVLPSTAAGPLATRPHRWK